MKGKLHNLIFIGMGLGVVVGMLLWQTDHDAAFYRNVVWFLDLIGKTVFVGSLKMLVAPLIFASIIAGVTSLPSSRDLGNLGWKTLAYYFCTTSVAVLIGLVLVNLIQPGRWDSSQKITEERAEKLAGYETQLRKEDKRTAEKLKNQLEGDELAEALTKLESSFQQRFMIEVSQKEESALHSKAELKARFERIQEKKQTPLAFIKDIIASMIQNPFRALTFSSSLGIIFFAILFGLACIAVGEKAQPVVSFFHAFNAVIMQLTLWVMMISPFAVFCLMASLISSSGPEVFKTLAGYVLTVILGIGLHVAALLAICRGIGKMSPAVFLRGIRDAWLIAFSTRSSAATLPVTIECVEDNLGVPKKVSEFVLPIGATVNMDGTALYEGVAVIFLLQMFGALPDVGIELGMLPMVLIFVTAVFASIGAAAVPDAGLITMVLVASAVGLPEYYLIFIFSVDAFLDMFRTSTNVMGDAVGSVVLARLYRDSQNSEQ